MPGILYIVPTPVGNLEDMTLRAIRILREADLILAEDTRTTSVLLKHYDIHGRLESHHKYNEHEKVQAVKERIASGLKVALVSDAGTPGISDPGFLLARARFVFEGFLPQKKGRQTLLEQLSHETRTMVFYESPFRLVKTLQQMAEFFGPSRRCSVAREISKVHEEHRRGTLEEVAAWYDEHAPKGEIVIVVEGAEPSKPRKKQRYGEGEEEGENS